MPPTDCTIGLGRPVVPDEYSTHSGAENGTGVNSGSAASRGQLVPADHAVRGRGAQRRDVHGAGQRRQARARSSATVSATSKVLAAVAVTVDGDQHRRRDLGEPVDHRRRAEIRASRTTTPRPAPRWPGSRPARASCSAPGRPPGRRPRHRADADRPARRRPRRAAPPGSARCSVPSSAMAITAGSSSAAARVSAQRVLGVVQRAAGEPVARPASPRRSAPRSAARASGSRSSRRPRTRSRQVLRGIGPQGGVVRELQAGPCGERGREVRDGGPRDPLGRGLPDHRRRVCRHGAPLVVGESPAVRLTGDGLIRGPWSRRAGHQRRRS